MGNPPPILVLSAFEPELAPLRRVLKNGSLPRSGVVCAAAGIGAVDAAIGAARAIAAHAPRLVLFIGTAGSYDAATALGSVAIARRIVLVSTAALRRDGYLPAPMRVRVDADSALRRTLARSTTGGPPLFVTDVITPLAITSSRALAARLAAATGAGAENLEAFAVARAADLAKLPLAAVLGISNRVGPGAHADWLRHQEDATAAASRVLQAFLLAALRAPIRSPKASRNPRALRK